MQQVFPYPFAFRNSQGTAAALTSAPVCTVFNGLNQATVGVSVDPVSGTITTMTPTSLVFGGGVVTPPTNVQVFLPVANGSLQVTYPTSGQTGTLYSVEGITRVKTITVREWTDYSLSANMATFAYEWLTSACNVVVEGTLPYLGLPTTYMSPGQAISIAGTNGTASYTTGFESAQLPVASVDIQFQPGSDGTFYTSVLHLSNRRQRYTSDIFVRPPQRGQQLGLSGGFSSGYYAGWSQAGSAGGLAGEPSAAFDRMVGAGQEAFEGLSGSPEQGGLEFGDLEPGHYQRYQLRSEKKQQAEHQRRLEREQAQGEMWGYQQVRRMTPTQYARFRGVGDLDAEGGGDQGGGDQGPAPAKTPAAPFSQPAGNSRTRPQETATGSWESETATGSWEPAPVAPPPPPKPAAGPIPAQRSTPEPEPRPLALDQLANLAQTR